MGPVSNQVGFSGSKHRINTGNAVCVFLYAGSMNPFELNQTMNTKMSQQTSSLFSKLRSKFLLIRVDLKDSVSCCSLASRRMGSAIIFVI